MHVLSIASYKNTPLVIELFFKLAITASATPFATSSPLRANPCRQPALVPQTGRAHRYDFLCKEYDNRPRRTWSCHEGKDQVRRGKVESDSMHRESYLQARPVWGLAGILINELFLCGNIYVLLTMRSKYACTSEMVNIKHMSECIRTYWDAVMHVRSIASYKNTPLVI